MYSMQAANKHLWNVMNNNIHRIIVHVDMDAFFSSIEQLDNPQCRERPVIVGADPKGGSGRGVVSAASYEARKYGIHSAMPISQAYRKCPGGIFVKPRMRRYAEISSIIMDIFYSFSPYIEPVSIDEAFLDCSGTEKLFGLPVELGKMIKQEIKSKTGLTASVGIATCKSIAKISSDLKKPDGLVVCSPGEEKQFLAPLPVKYLWGAGKKTQKLLSDMGCHTIGDVAAIDKKVFESTMGKWGIHLWELANGIDPRKVETEHATKSMSEEVTYEHDILDEEVILHTIHETADRLSRRVRKSQYKFRTVTLKIRLEGFETYTRSRTVREPADDMYTIRDEAIKLYTSFGRGNMKVRLVGVKVSNLVEYDRDSVQLDLFDTCGEDTVNRQNTEKFERILDELRDRYGKHVSRASMLHRRRDRWE